MTFSEILEKRIALYRRGSGGEIYDLYSAGSKFREFFPERDEFIKHFEKMRNEQVPVNIEVFRESHDDLCGEVLYIEVFQRGERAVKYYSKSQFVKEGGLWKISDEKREEQYIKD